MVAIVQLEVEVLMLARSNVCRIVVALMLVASACDKSNGDGAEPAQTQGAKTADPAPTSAPTEGKFSVKLKVSGTAETYSIEGTLKPEEVQTALESALYATEAFEKGGPRELTGMITYDVKELPDKDGHEVVLFGALNSPSANFSAGVQHQSTDDRWVGRPLSTMIEGAVEKFASQIGAQARVVGGDDATLLKILENTEEPQPARLMAIQEIRERRLDQHIETLRKYLDPEQPLQLRMAAAAALVSLGDKESRADIIKLAEDLSRDRDPKYVPMLHILGDLGGDEVVTYLEAVAEGHSAPAVRSVAAEALKKAQSGGAP